MLKEFKDFALKGNVLDLAIAVIIGGAFGKIVESLVNDIIMPIVGRMSGGVDFSNLYFALAGKIDPGTPYVKAKEAGSVLGYGNFIQITVNFLIVAAVLFLIVRFFNSLKKQEASAPAAAPETPADNKLLGEIRDLLKK